MDIKHTFRVNIALGLNGEINKSCAVRHRNACFNSHVAMDKYLLLIHTVQKTISYGILIYGGLEMHNRH